jgi:ABC-2 type transport system permease protein
MRKIWVVVRKEWAEVFKNRFVLFTVAFMPLIATAIPLMVLYLTRQGSELGDLTTGDIPSNFTALCGSMSPGECGQYFLISQFMLLFMLIPLAIPVTFAAYSIVGEKTTRTLEPVLATPITTFELLGGKMLAAVVPAISVTWIAFGAFAGGAWLIVGNSAALSRVTDALWLSAIFVLSPLMALAAVCIAVMVSSRTSEPRVAEQLSMLVILPLLGLFFGQISGLFFINEQLILWMAVFVGILDLGLLAFAGHLFQRETILTRWK